MHKKCKFVVYWMHGNFPEDKCFKIVQCKYFAPDHGQLMNIARFQRFCSMILASPVY